MQIELNQGLRTLLHITDMTTDCVFGRIAIISICGVAAIDMIELSSPAAGMLAIG